MQTISERIHELKNTMHHNSSPDTSSIQIHEDDLRLLLSCYDENQCLYRKNSELRALDRLYRLASKDGIERDYIEAKLSKIKIYLRELGYKEDSVIPKDEAYEVMKKVQIDTLGSSFLPHLESYTTETFSYIAIMITLNTVIAG